MSTGSEQYQVVLSYTQKFTGVSGKPGRISGIDSPEDKAKFVQAMREKGLSDETEEDLLKMLERAKKAIVDDYNLMF